MTNERYTGCMRLQKFYTTDSIPTKKHWNKGEAKQYYIENTHEAIISKDDFEKVQELLKKNSSQYCKESETASPFGGIIKCGYCGESYKRKNRNGVPCWVCRKHDNKSLDCRSKAISEEKITQAFISLANKLILHYKEILIPLQRGLNELNTIKFRGNSRVLDIRKDIAALKEQRHVIARLRKKGFLDEQKYNEQLSALEGKIQRQDNELKKIAKADDSDEMVDQLDLLISCIEKQTSVLNEFDSELFSEIVDRMIIKDKEIYFELLSGLEFKEILR